MASPRARAASRRNIVKAQVSRIGLRGMRRPRYPDYMRQYMKLKGVR